MNRPSRCTAVREFTMSRRPLYSFHARPELDFIAPRNSETLKSGSDRYTTAPGRLACDSLRPIPSSISFLRWVISSRKKAPQHLKAVDRLKLTTPWISSQIWISANFFAAPEAGKLHSCILQNRVRFHAVFSQKHDSRNNVCSFVGMLQKIRPHALCIMHSVDESAIMSLHCQYWFGSRFFPQTWSFLFRLL